MSIEWFAIAVDKIGLATFSYITIYSAYLLRQEHKTLNDVRLGTVILLLLGLLGLIVDGYIVIKSVIG